MNIKQSLEILREHNRWRRGADIPMQHPALLGEAIDKIVYYVEMKIKEEEYER